jgi:hypothetical protein
MTIEAARDNRRRQSNMSDRRHRISESFPNNENPDELKKSFDEWMKIVADNV